MLDKSAGCGMSLKPIGAATGIQLLRRGTTGKAQQKRLCASSDHAYEVGILTETCRTELQRVLAHDEESSFVAVSRNWTTHARAGHMTLLRNGHSLLRARCHLRVTSSARVPLALVLRLLLLTMERRCEGRSLLAVLLLHMRREALMRTGGLHHVRTRAWRASVPVRTRALLRHVWHLRLSVWRHGRVSLVLLRHESV